MKNYSNSSSNEETKRARWIEKNRLEWIKEGRNLKKEIREHKIICYSEEMDLHARGIVKEIQ